MAMQRWLGVAKIEKGPIFRVVHGKDNIADRAISTQGITTVLRRYWLPTGVSPHSFRVGFVTQSRLDGVPDSRILGVTDHSGPVRFEILRNAAQGRWCEPQVHQLSRASLLPGCGKKSFDLLPVHGNKRA